MSVPAGGPSPLDLRQLERELHQTWPAEDGLRVLYERAVTLLRLVRESVDLLKRTHTFVDSQSSVEAARVRAHALRDEIRQFLLSVTDET